METGRSFFKYFHKKRDLWQPVSSEFNRLMITFANEQNMTFEKLNKDIDLYINHIQGL